MPLFVGGKSSFCQPPTHPYPYKSLSLQILILIKRYSHLTVHMWEVVCVLCAVCNVPYALWQTNQTLREVYHWPYLQTHYPTLADTQAEDTLTKDILQIYYRCNGCIYTSFRFTSCIYTSCCQPADTPDAATLAAYI